MGEKQALSYDGKRFSVRASITLWLVIAAAFWIFVGAILGVATQWNRASLEAEVKALSTVSPAAGSVSKPEAKSP
jgi:hypothetical protein